MPLTPPAPYDHIEFDQSWRDWLTQSFQFEVAPAPGVGGSPATPIVISTSTYIAGNEARILLADTDQVPGDITITMPEASRTNLVYHIKKLGNSGNVIVTGDGTQTIDDGLIATLVTEDESIMIVSDAAKWYVI